LKPRPFKTVYKLHFSASCEALRHSKSIAQSTFSAACGNHDFSKTFMRRALEKLRGKHACKRGPAYAKLKRFAKSPESEPDA
jgi:hypothetical protein